MNSNSAILQNSSRRWSYDSAIKNIKFETSASFIDGNNIPKKFMVVKKAASDFSGPNFWDLIWKTDSRVIVQFDKGTSIRHKWLNSDSSLAYDVGRFTLWKKTVIDKYYTQIILTVRNNKEKKTKKIMHYQYHEFPDQQTPFYSAQLISFWKIVNKKYEGITSPEEKENGLCPIVMYSAGWFERLVSICAIDICLDQLTEEQSVSVPDTLLDVKYQVSFDSISAEEQAFIDKTVKHIKSALLWKNEQDDSEPRNASFRDRVRKYCLLFKRPSVF
ncbi:protein tyrosine phosphatase [Cotesia plutellae polydnavirus]|nr:protein tyrosine phosphatase [Cotesia plutellae polydnavirus]AEE09473.1 protein tyrosine phosphatase [Cotesia vestalis bracovirus]